MRKLLLILFTAISIAAMGQKPCTPPSISMILPPHTICPGDTVQIGVDATGGNTPYTYLWEPTGDTTSTISVVLDSTTTFTVTVKNSCGDSATKFATINVSVPKVSLPPITYMALGDSIIIIARGNCNSYQWSPSNVRCLDSPLCDSIKVSPSTTTIYTVTGTLSGVCQAFAVDTVEVGATGVMPVFNEQQINVYPNPSSTEFTITLQNKALLQISDVTGRMLFSETKNAGTINFGKELSPGTYLLIIDGKPAGKLVKL